MNWEAIAAVGQVVGALAVIVTLLYLAKQLKEQTRSLRVQSLHAQFAEYNTILAELQSLEGIGTAYRKTLAGEALTLDEEYELMFMYARIFNLNEKMFYLHLSGVADDFIKHKFERTIAPILASSYFKQWWEKNKYRYFGEFIEYVEKLVTDRNDTHSPRVADASPGL